MKIEHLEQVFETLEIDQINYGGSDGTDWFGNGRENQVISPINGRKIAVVKQANQADYEKIIKSSQAAFKIWRTVPAPKRGDIIRQLGAELRKYKESLGKLVTIEMGKSIQEGYGEVQEMIDICDMAVGESRMLRGVQTNSEREQHRMFEQWHPFGIVGVISAYNFPVAVWSWNTALALICGNVCLWKPASPSPLTAIACQKIISRILTNNNLPPAISTLVIGKGSEIGDFINKDKRIPLISYTGSTKMGTHLAELVAKRLGKTILELGGNNAIIVTEKADLKLAAQNVLFGAIGTAGQRCTSTRRVIIQDSVYDEFKTLLNQYYDKITIGNPMDERNLMGPVVDTTTVKNLFNAIARVQEEGGQMLRTSEKLNEDQFPGGCYVTPAIAEVPENLPIVKEETFAPILYLMKYNGDLDKAMELHNDVPQGLSSAIFSNDLLESEYFLSCLGSDCGIANVNLGTSGAEIGLAFGGEKETGGGRESGSDAWKSYMRRQSCTINWSGKTVLAQGIKFD